MALIVEDGTGLSTAESYISVADASAYFSTRGNPSAWSSASVSEQEAALRYATEWIDLSYSFNSTIILDTQALKFPRKTFYDSEGREITGVPQVLKNATCETALNHLTTNLNASDERGSLILSEKVGSSTTTYKQGGSSSSDFYITKLLKELGKKVSSSSEIFRA